MRSYAATPNQVLWKLQVPAALPYLFPALKIAATASIIGAIVGELPASALVMSDTTGSAAAAPRKQRVKAAPSVRALARELGVDLTRIEGSGPGGRITAKDVAGAAKAARDATPPSPGSGGMSPTASRPPTFAKLPRLSPGGEMGIRRGLDIERRSGNRPMHQESNSGKPQHARWWQSRAKPRFRGESVET